jgi:DHA2 family multidrug resistance protein-like MFS transporter
VNQIGTSIRPWPESQGSEPPAGLPASRGPRRWIALAVVCLAVIVIVMDGSIVNVALPTLAIKLPGATNASLQWIVDAYILVFAALLLVAGSAADRFGRRLVLALGLIVFAGVSFGAALSDTSGSLILWRAAMGVGAALIFPSTLAIITEDFPEPGLRRAAIAVWAGSSGLGVAIGPVAGGWLLAHLHWGSIFLVNLPVVLVSIAGVMAFVRESRERHHSRFDPFGSVLSIAGVFGVVWGLIEAPERGWSSPVTVAALAGGVALLGAFVAWERRTPAPMLDVRYFSDPRFAGGCIAVAAAFFGLFGFVFMVTQYFQFLHGYGALSAGIRTTPFAGFILGGALIAARAGRWCEPRWIIAAGLLLMSAGFAWAAGDDKDTAYSLMVWQMGVLGTGLGLVNAAATEVIMASLPLSRAGTGSSVNDTLREVGGTLGVAGMGSAFNALYRAKVTGSLASAPLPEDARAMVRASVGGAMLVIERVESVAGPDAATKLRASVEAAFLSGFSGSCWIACAAAAIGAVAVAAVMRSSAATYAGITVEGLASKSREE